MKRQKQIHDTRASYEKFGVGDNVYVYFPVKKVGTSSKFTSFWRGPYQIMGKLSEVLYKVNCGRNKTTQVIHCNRIKKCREQTLTGEAGEAEVGNEGMEDIYENTDVHFPDPAINDSPITEVMISYPVKRDTDDHQFGRKTMSLGQSRRECQRHSPN